MAEIAPKRRIVPLIVACALFMENLDSTIVSTALPALARSLGEDPLHLSLAITSYLLSLAIFIPLSGWMADRYGARNVFRNAIAIFVLGSIGCALSEDIAGLVAARMLQGLGGAMMVPVGRLVLLREIPKRELVSALATVTMPALVAPLLGPPVGGFIVTYVSWRWIFLINVPIGVLGWWLVSRHIRHVPQEERPPLDLAGWWLLGGGLAGLVLGFESIGKHVIPDHAVLIALAGGVVLLGLYAWHSRDEAFPILDLSLLKLPTFRATVTGGTLFRIGVGAYTLLLPMMLQLGFGFSSLRSGLTTFAAAIGALGMKMIAERVTRRFGFRDLLVWNTAICSAVLFACGWITPGWPQVLMILFLVGAGFLRSLQFTCINALAFADVDSARMSRATSLSSTAQQLSLTMGVGIASQILNASLGWRHASVLAIADFKVAFTAISLISIASLLSFRTLARDAGQAVSGHDMALADEVSASAQP